MNSWKKACGNQKDSMKSKKEIWQNQTANDLVKTMAKHSKNNCLKMILCGNSESLANSKCFLVKLGTNWTVRYKIYDGLFCLSGAYGFHWSVHECSPGFIFGVGGRIFSPVKVKCLQQWCFWLISMVILETGMQADHQQSLKRTDPQGPDHSQNLSKGPNSWHRTKVESYQLRNLYCICSTWELVSWNSWYWWAWIKTREKRTGIYSSL